MFLAGINEQYINVRFDETLHILSVSVYTHTYMGLTYTLRETIQIVEEKEKGGIQKVTFTLHV